MDKYEQLEKITKLKELGILSEEEFQREKDKILNSDKIITVKEVKQKSKASEKISINKNKLKIIISVVVLVVLIIGISVYFMNSDSGMVKIPGKDFKMDITEVTNKEYEKCVNKGKCKKQYYTDGKCYVFDGSEWVKGNISSEFKEDKKPAVCVDWQQAKSYCEWAGKRLPTEEEWEYAAIGGENYKYSGSDNPDEVAWYEANSENKTHEVATKKANGYGLYDVSGNVREWTNSWYDSSTMTRVLIGGGFYDRRKRIRADSRSRYSGVPTDIASFFGFRCVQDVE